MVVYDCSFCTEVLVKKISIGILNPLNLSLWEELFILILFIFCLVLLLILCEMSWLRSGNDRKTQGSWMLPFGYCELPLFGRNSHSVLAVFFLYLNTYVGKKYFKCYKVAKPVYKIKAVVISWEKQTNLNAKLIFIIEMMGIYFLVFSLILHNLGVWFQSSCCSLLTVHLTQHSSSERC